uniref:Uncharacterized protein n=1 Tax=Alexandrium catenella TaxID=2925 RepID=A0A7S1REI2_ALECA
MGANASTEAASATGIANEQQGALGQDASRQQPKQNYSGPDANIKSCHLRGVVPSQAFLEKEAELLAPFCARGTFPQPRQVRRQLEDFEDFPSLLEDGCRKHRISLLDMQALMLPPWGLGWGMAFPSKAELFNFVGKKPASELLGELVELDIPGTYLNIADDGITIRSARWAELLDGTAIIRLMSGGTPAVMRMWADTRTIGASLEALRKVRWSPDLQWAFPFEYQRRMLFICCLGRRLGVARPAWQVVVSFLACLSPDEIQAAMWGMRRPGQVVEYYSKTNGGWMPCRVSATDPIRNSIMLDIKPNHWLSPADQATHIRASQQDLATAKGSARAPRRHSN